MNKSFIIKELTTVLMCVLLFSCSSEDDGDVFPAGEYPLTFTASVEEQLTRSTSASSWDGGEEVAIRIASTIKKYTTATDGKLSATSGVEPFYWQSQSETKTVTGWYPYSISAPTSWSVQSDQRTGGYQQSDFLYAPAVAISFANRETTTLPFHHQTVKLVINIVNGEATSSATDISAVKIGVNNNLALSGNYTAPAGNNSQGTWSNLANSGIVTPKEISPTGTFLKSYAALVIPQSMTNKKFIAVTLSNGNTYYYSPSTGDADLEGGKQYTYNITVKNSGITVVTSDITDWTNTTNPPTSGGAGVYKVGDYYPDPNVIYSSPGVVQSGTAATGIIFWLDPADSRHGKIMGLDQTLLAWGDNTDTTIGASNIDNGLANMAVIKGLDAVFNNFPAFAWVDSKNGTVGTTAYTNNAKGVWYLPALNELLLLYNTYAIDKGAFIDKLNRAGGVGFSIGYFDQYKSSTESSSSNTSIIYFDNGEVSPVYKTSQGYVRAIMAF